MSQQRVPGSSSLMETSNDSNSLYHPSQPSRPSVVPNFAAPSGSLQLSRPTYNLNANRYFEQRPDLPSIETPSFFISSNQIPSFDIEGISTLRSLGGGTYGECHLVEVPRLGKVVLKRSKRMNFVKSAKEVVMEKRELACSRMLNHHPNIVAFYGEVYQGAHSNITGFLMEYLPGGSLSSYMEAYHANPQTYAVFLELQNSWAYQIALGLAYIHSRKIMHRDLNPNNVLIGNPCNIAKISDFGFSRELTTDHTSFTTEVGTGVYRAPETLLETNYRYPIDVWSYAMTLYFIFAKQMPFGDNIFKKMSIFSIRSTLTGDLGTVPLRPTLNLGVIDNLIERCWQTLATDRPTMDEVLVELESVVPGPDTLSSVKKYPTVDDM